LLHGAAFPDTLSPEKTLYKIIKNNPVKKYIKIRKLCNFFSNCREDVLFGCLPRKYSLWGFRILS